MSLNIKSADVHALARELAGLTGTSMTGAVEDALRRRIEEVTRQDRRARMRQTLREIQETFTDEDRAAARRLMDEMYDKDGLPV